MPPRSPGRSGGPCLVPCPPAASPPSALLRRLRPGSNGCGGRRVEPAAPAASAPVDPAKKNRPGQRQRRAAGRRADREKASEAAAAADD
eukprot:190660-Alexandrium_andersonii.AAC.1